MFCIFILLLVSINSTIAFLPNPIYNARVHSKTSLQILPIESALESIIANKALMSALMSNLRRELTVERAIIEFSTSFNPNSFFYASIIVTYIYGEYRFFEGSRAKNDKLKEFPVYQKTEKIVKEIIIMLLFVMFKEVHSAT